MAPRAPRRPRQTDAEIRQAGHLAEAELGGRTQPKFEWSQKQWDSVWKKYGKGKTTMSKEQWRAWVTKQSTTAGIDTQTWLDTNVAAGAGGTEQRVVAPEQTKPRVAANNPPNPTVTTSANTTGEDDDLAIPDFTGQAAEDENIDQYQALIDETLALPITSGWTPEMIHNMQLRLANSGYYEGTPTFVPGVWDARTEAAWGRLLNDSLRQGDILGEIDEDGNFSDPRTGQEAGAVGDIPAIIDWNSTLSRVENAGGYQDMDGNKVGAGSGTAAKTKVTSDPAALRAAAVKAYRDIYGEAPTPDDENRLVAAFQQLEAGTNENNLMSAGPTGNQQLPAASDFFEEKLRAENPDKAGGWDIAKPAQWESFLSAAKVG